MSTLYNIVKQLQETSSTNEKLAIMQENKDNTLFKEYVRLATCPSINFYITEKTYPVAEHVGEYSIDEAHWTVKQAAMKISNREVTGNAAKAYILDYMHQLNTEGQELFKMMLLKDIKAKIGVTLVNKVWNNLCVSIPYQRCSLASEKTLAKFKTGEGFIVQTKGDGIFASLVLEPSQWNEDVKLFTRNGNKFPQHFSEYIADGLNDMNSVYEGELLCFRNSELLSRKEGNGILNSVMQGGELPSDVSVQYHVWNRLPVADWKAGKTNKTYNECWDKLCELFAKHHPRYPDRIEVIDHYYVDSLEQAYAFNKKQLEAGLEGSIIKTLTHKWRDGTSKECVKLKLAVEIDLIWKDSTEGKGKASGMLGAMCLESECGKLKVDCGTGFSDNQRRVLWENKDKLHGSIVTISANDIVSREGSDTMSLFLPVFTELREKTQADSLERIQQIFNAAKHIS